MKVALLLPGFIRNKSHFESVNAFIKLNDKYEIDVFCNTYDVTGIETKEPSDKSIYLNTEKTDRALIEARLNPKAVNKKIAAI